MKWNDLFQEKPSSAHRRAVLRAARSELRAHRQRRWQWLRVAAPMAGFSLALVMTVWLLQPAPPYGSTDSEALAALQSGDFEMLEDLSLYQNLELLELMDELDRDQGEDVDG